MEISIREDFGGIRMERDREDLINRLDYILRQLDMGLEYLRQDESWLFEDDIQERKNQYGGT